MFCPLCRAEFRPGFIACSDCHVPLVATFDEAAAASAQLWKGSNEEELNRILAALDAQEIVSHYNERAHVRSSFMLPGIPLSTLLGIPLSKRTPMSEYEVWVFRKDFEPAKAAISLPSDQEDED
jgi:hypothetical protein